MNLEALKKLSKAIDTNAIDGLIIGISSDLEYLTGFNPRSCERVQALFLSNEGNMFYLVPEIIKEEAGKTFNEEIELVSWSDEDGYLKKLQEAFKYYRFNNKAIAVNDGISAIDLLDIKSVINASFVNGKVLLEEIRVCKTTSELRYLRIAARLADEVMEEMTKYIKPGMQERKIKHRIEELFIEKGASGLAFEPIIASGPNSSKPHYNDNKRTIEDNDIIILDFGCKYEGYCSDISRTFFIGNPTNKQKEIYEVVQKANQAAINTVKPGISAGTVDKAARNAIENEGYGEYFLSRTGHGIGVGVHEAPYIKAGSPEVLKKGMAFSIEPGIYISGEFGVRIEDIVVVTERDVEVLNKFPRELISI